MSTVGGNAVRFPYLAFEAQRNLKGGPMLPSRGLFRSLKTHVTRHPGPLGSVIAVKTSDPCFILTFDDGPHPSDTLAILDELATVGATATFFVLVSAVRRNPSLLDEIMSGGHEVALHGMDHKSLREFRYNEMLERCLRGRADLEDRIGTTVRWFRPPYGEQTLLSLLAVKNSRMTPVFWSATTWDWRDGVTVAERVAKSVEHAHRGSILLAHDGHASTADNARDSVIPDLDKGNLMRLVLDEYARRGLAGRALGQSLINGEPISELRFV